jgi:Spy/CpxP family protein refolding chaperone
MICLAAAIGVLGIAAMGRAHRCGRGVHEDGWHGPYGDDMSGHGGRRRWMLRALFRRIDATPAQERAVVAELEKLEDRVHAAKAGVHDARGDLAAAVRGAVLDDAALGAVLGRVDAAIGEVRSAVIDALRGVHGLLDDRQRGQIAELLERRGGWRRGPTPGPAPVQV